MALRRIEGGLASKRGATREHIGFDLRPRSNKVSTPASQKMIANALGSLALIDSEAAPVLQSFSDGGRIPSAGFDVRANTGIRQKTRRPQVFSSLFWRILAICGLTTFIGMPSFFHPAMLK